MCNQIELYSKIKAFDNEFGFEASFPEGIINHIRKNFTNDDNFKIKEFERFVKSNKLPEKALNKILSAFFVYGFNAVINVSVYAGTSNFLNNILINERECKMFPTNAIRKNAMKALSCDEFSCEDKGWIDEFKNNHGVRDSRLSRTYKTIQLLCSTSNITILHTVNAIISLGVDYATKLLSHFQTIAPEIRIWNCPYSPFHALNSGCKEYVSKIELGNIYFVKMTLGFGRLPYLLYGAGPDYIDFGEDDCV